MVVDDDAGKQMPRIGLYARRARIVGAALMLFGFVFPLLFGCHGTRTTETITEVFRPRDPPPAGATDSTRQARTTERAFAACEFDCLPYLEFVGNDRKVILYDIPKWTSFADYEFRQVRDDESDAKAFSRKALLKAVAARNVSVFVVAAIRDLSVTPSVVKRGTSVVITIDYSLVWLDSVKTPYIKEEWRISGPAEFKKGAISDGLPREGLDIFATAQRRAPGGWRSSVTIHVPDDVAVGKYSVHCSVWTGSQMDERYARFIVQ